MDVDEGVRALLEGHWYDALATLLAARRRRGRPDPRLDAALQFASAARHVLDLDAEDFGQLADAFPREEWRRGLRDACFPPDPREPPRGALASLVPLYELMLEVMDIRAQRQEPLQVVVTAHLIAEYLPQLAWESTLGHAGDPLRLGRTVGERWGTDDPVCAHTPALRATARRALHAAQGDAAGWTAYLDRFHSRQGEALAVCAMNHTVTRPGDRPDAGDTCPHPCRWVLRGPLEHRRDLDARVRLARLYQGSALVALRHHAPVGHFFGVPSVAEISAAWVATWSRLSQQWPDGDNPLAASGAVQGAPDEHEALPGLSALVSAVAGRTIGPGRLIRSIGATAAASLAEES